MLPAAVRKWLNRPKMWISLSIMSLLEMSYNLTLLRGALSIKRSDPRLLAQFFFADELVTQVVTEIICLDVQEDPQHYLVLLSQLHASQGPMPDGSGRGETP
ncbi:uncharacterized protein [Petaurus breviceps papuanus]|uniref:uncharacterized protein isoform X2 n=1 Tax=Petaurus breviceps papuanus TaxID=3040969 RepID=UPI0036DC8509